MTWFFEGRIVASKEAMLQAEKDKYGEISKLIVKLQFAVEGKDTDQVQDQDPSLDPVIY